jgi:hypothetical protein
MRNTQSISHPNTSGSYSERMSALREQLRGRPYCVAIKNMLPDVSKATIHGAINGRNENELVLSALRIAIFKMDKSEEEARDRLSKEAELLGITV